MASDWEGVSISSSSLFTPEPTWNRLDTLGRSFRVAQIRIDRGRQSEFDDTGTGTCAVTYHSRGGYLDPTRGSAPSLVSKPLAIALFNPVTSEWWPVFRGHMERNSSTLQKNKSSVSGEITAVDAFDYFSNVELIPGLAGFANAQLNAQGNVFYEDAGFDERILAILGDLNWPVELSSVFTGNVIVDESIYAAGDHAMQALQEAVDAEFPDMANQYIDTRGIYQAHGRYARFDPEGVAASASNWEFNDWFVGDDDACHDSPATYARLVEPLAYDDSRTEIRNAALCYPHTLERTDLSDFIVTDGTSVGQHGYRTWQARNLKVLEETTIGLTAKEWCQYIAQYVVDNYAQPVPRLDAITVMSQQPDGHHGAAAWDFLCRADISDRVTVKTSHPGGGGFDNTVFFIEGVSMTVDYNGGPMDCSNGTFPIVRKTVKLSPASRYFSAPWGGVLPT